MRCERRNYARRILNTQVVWENGGGLAAGPAATTTTAVERSNYACGQWETSFPTLATTARITGQTLPKLDLRAKADLKIAQAEDVSHICEFEGLSRFRRRATGLGMAPFDAVAHVHLSFTRPDVDSCPAAVEIALNGLNLSRRSDY